MAASYVTLSADLSSAVDCTAVIGDTTGDEGSTVGAIIVVTMCVVSFVDRRAQRSRSVVVGGEPHRHRLDIGLPFGGGHDQLEDCVIV